MRTGARDALREWWPIVAIAVLVGVIKAEGLADPNVLWGTRDGLDVTSSWHLTSADAWSWTVIGKHWVPNSWGWDVVLAELYRFGGGGALAVLNIAVIVGLFSAMAWQAKQRGGSSLSSVLVMGVLGAVALIPWLNDRPQLISYAFVMVFVAAVGPLLQRDRRRFGYLLAALVAGQVLWINLHLFGVLGPGLLAAAGCGHLFGQWRGAPSVAIREQVARLSITVAAAVLACGATPYGPLAAAKAFAVRNAATGLIEEWQPAGFGTYSQVTALLALAVAVPAVALAWRGHRYEVALVVVPLGLAAAIACRFAPVLAVVALPEASAALARMLERRFMRFAALAVSLLVAAVGVGVAQAGLDKFGQLDTADTDPQLLAKLPPSCRVLNDYKIGGAIVFFRKDVHVAIDSRTDLYGRNRILANRALVRGSASSVAELAAADVTCVLVPKAAGIVALLRTAPGWRVVASDATRTLLVRE